LVYCASKAGLRGFTMALRAQLAETYVRVFSHFIPSARPALVNGAAGFVASDRTGQPFSVLASRRQAGISCRDMLADPERLRHLNLAALDD